MRDKLLAAAIPCLAAGLLLGVLPAQTVAADPDFDPATVYSVRLQPPGAGVTELLHANFEFLGLTLFGGSMSARFARLVEAEVGGNAIQGICEGGPVFFARAGLSPSLVRARAEGTHWNLRLPILAGYLGYSGSVESCDTTPAHDLHAMTFSTGMEATHWSSSRAGLNLRLLFTAGPVWVKETSPYVSSPVPTAREWLMELGLAIGLAIR